MKQPNPFTVERLQREMHAALAGLVAKIQTGDPPQQVSTFLLMQTPDGVLCGGSMHPVAANVLLSQVIVQTLQ